MNNVLALPGDVSRTGLQLPNDLTFERWKDIGEQLKLAESSVSWWVGDWLAFGEKKYGEMYQEAMDVTGAAYQTLANAKYVSDQIEISRRRENLSFSHHAEVASLEPAIADKLLRDAEKHEWKRKDLRHHITKMKRDDRHKEIANAAPASSITGNFALIYADPPWTFDTYSWKGKELGPEKHYPTLDDEAIKGFEVDGRHVSELANKDAALFLWCTSSNMFRAGAILEAWGFTYKTQAIWDKERTGTGYVFLNRHEHLLYGTRGNMPAPQAIRSSVFSYPRGRHSEKPQEIRAVLDEMYPRFDAKNKIELFAREATPGWTVDGFESHSHRNEREVA
jgi:N6-adenosine-specific RNA methylase IME4